MNRVIEELKIEDKSELRDLEHLFSWATQVGRGEVLPADFVYFEDTEEEPLLVRRSAVTSIRRTRNNESSYIGVEGTQMAVQGSYEATIAKVLGPEFRSPRA